MNKAILIGRLTKDAELRVTPSGVKVSSFTIAVDRGMSKESKAQAQQKGEPTADFINCVCFNKIAEFVATYCKKGNLVAVDGKIQTRSYDDKDGKKVYVTEVLVNQLDKLEWNDTKKEEENWYTEVETNEEEIPF
jgi:single-strand DNA-binding protein